MGRAIEPLLNDFRLKLFTISDTNPIFYIEVNFISKKQREIFLVATLPRVVCYDAIRSQSESPILRRHKPLDTFNIGKCSLLKYTLQDQHIWVASSYHTLC